jgi:hypothetical protein
MIFKLPILGIKSTWLVLALKILAAAGFMTAANLTILYAC